MACNRHPLDERIQVRADGSGFSHNGQTFYFGGHMFTEDGYVCGVCGTYVPKSKSLRGKRANRRGRRESARIAKDIGGQNREVEGKPFDVTNEMYAVQSKKDNGLFSERIWKALQAIPAEELIPVLVVRDSPGPGKRVRGYAVMKYDDFLDTTGVKA